MIIAGIDPGLSGAVAEYDVREEKLFAVINMPVLEVGTKTKRRREIDAHALANFFWKAHIGHVFLEQSWSRPADSGVNAWAFAEAYGTLRGIIATVGVPLTLVAPQRWKKALGVSADKDGARARASQLMPEAAEFWPYKKDHGLAEAALIALYGVRSLQSIARGEAA